MFSKIRRVRLLWFLLMATGILFSRPVAARDIDSFDGTWEGKLEVVDGTSKKDESFERTKAAYGKSSFKITMHRQRASVYFGEAEAKPGKFRAQIYMTNAVVFASDTGEDNDGRWVETWNFAMTQKNPETLIVVFSRVVNNLDVPGQPHRNKFFVVAVGEFRRMSP
jgi:hypothetical protein